MKKNTTFLSSLRSWWLFIAVFAGYFIFHFWRLGTFPVFADEAIYIRWAQLFMDDAKQYAFFSLNDGKTPLFIWMLASVQSLFSDQLIAARFVSVLGGAVQLVAMLLILKEFTQRKATLVIGALAVTFLPFWFTYHRFAMMDGWLTAFLSLSFWAGLKVVKSQKGSRLRWALVSGIFFGLALWTKLPALFFLPTFAFLSLFSERLGGKKVELSSYFSVKVWPQFLPYIAAAGIGMGIFALLRLAPGFGQLFHRGQDFSYTLNEVVQGKWKESFANLWRFTTYFGAYLTWPVLLMSVAGLFSTKERKSTALLLLSALAFMSPFIVLGKVVYPRYLLPAVSFLTIAAVLNLETLALRCSNAVRNGKFLWAAFALLFALVAGQVCTMSMYFDASFMFTPDVTPFVKVDRQQYLEEWSSGHGIRQTVELIRQLSQSHTVAIATEGRFGTLPDALLLYFHNRDVHNIYIEGTGQYPVKSIPDFFTNKAKSFDQDLLVVNSHRMELKLPAEKLIAQYCRPNQAPCLQVWDVTDLVKAGPSTQTP